MTTRLEAAVKAIAYLSPDEDFPEWNTQFRDSKLDAAERALAASDAVLLSDATVERAARALNQHYLIAWEELPEWARQDARKDARAVLAAALKEDQ